jgi:hypothetical protein
MSTRFAKNILENETPLLVGDVGGIVKYLIA